VALLITKVDQSPLETETFINSNQEEWLMYMFNHKDHNTIQELNQQSTPVTSLPTVTTAKLPSVMVHPQK